MKMEVVKRKPTMGETSKYSFTKFPPEVRNMIYELLPLKFSEPIIVSSSKGILTNKRFKKRRRYCRTGILRVDKQTYQEVSPHFYSQNTFLFGNSPSRDEANLEGLQQFIARVPAHHLAAIQDVGISCHWDYKRTYASRSEWLYMMEKILKHFTGAMLLRLGELKWLTTAWRVVGYCLDGRGSEAEKTFRWFFLMWLSSHPDRDLHIKGSEIPKIRSLLNEISDHEPRIAQTLHNYDNG